MKNTLLFVLILLVGFSCATENPDYKTLKPLSEAWICHNPRSELHGELCIEEVHLLRGKHQPCYWTTDGPHNGQGIRNPDSFCWLLEREDCEGTLEYDWQEKNCHFFRDSEE